jgi:hypothetical protein
MEAQEMCEFVASAWPFNPEKYPALEGCTPKETKTFILSHILKHQGGTLETCWTGLSRGKVPHDMDTRIAIHKLVFNSIRFATILNVRPDVLNASLEDWSRPSAGRRLGAHTFEQSLEIFNKVSVNKSLLDPIEEFIRSVLRTGTFLEKADHGNGLSITHLKMHAAQAMTLSVRLARIHYYSREEFENWLPTQKQLN